MNFLWISRHLLNEDQKNGLERIFGEVEVRQWDGTLEHPDQLGADLDWADAVGAVLPIGMMAELKGAMGEKRLLMARSGRKETGGYEKNGEKEYRFVHLYWEEIKRLELEIEILQ